MKLPHDSKISKALEVVQNQLTNVEWLEFPPDESSEINKSKKKSFRQCFFFIYMLVRTCLF